MPYCQEIKNKEIWESFLLRCIEKTFMQSWSWGEFQEKMGNKIWRLGVFDGGNLVGISLITKLKARRGTFLFTQHGPLFANIEEQAAADKLEILRTLSDELKKIGKEEKASFVRIAPLLPVCRSFSEGTGRGDENEEFFRKLGFREAPMHANAYSATWKLDITLSEEELLKNMRKTTRYLIRQAQKNNEIEILQSQKMEDVDIFDKLLREVSKTQSFVPFSAQYAKNEFSVFNKDNQVSLFFGKYQGKIVAGAFVVFWSNVGFYHHAALLSEYHKLPLSYLLQWEVIKEAKRRGCVLYDFWGFTDPEKYPEHPWAGPTFFKMGFGGKAYEYVKTQDLPFSKKYWLIYFFEKLRKIRRGL